MSIKATSALSILAIWAAMIPAIIVEPDVTWTIIFAGLATAAIGVSAWRRLGVSRLIAIAGTWAATAIAISQDPSAAWISVFAFLTTGAVVYSPMKRDAWIAGLGIVVAWGVVAAVSNVSEGDAAWIAVFAFLTAGTVAAGPGSGTIRGGSAILWWGIAGAVMLIADASAWSTALAVAAFILTGLSLGLSDFRLPTRFEWDLFDRDDGSDEPREARRGERSFDRGERAFRRSRWRSGGSSDWSGFPFEDREEPNDEPPAVR